MAVAAVHAAYGEAVKKGQALARLNALLGVAAILVIAAFTAAMAAVQSYSERLMRDCLRRLPSGRYGGEEFVIILPDTDAAGAKVLAEWLRQQVFALDIEHVKSPYGKVTISLGVASMIPGQDDDAQALVEASDRALYAAKHGGKNCVR